MTQAKHFTDLAIRGFRGLKDVTLEKLGRINVIVGAADVGKTSVLEAAFLLSGFGGIPLPAFIQHLRGHAVRSLQDLLLLFNDPAGDGLHLSASTPRDERRLTISVAHANLVAKQKPYLDFRAQIAPQPSGRPKKYRGKVTVRDGEIRMDLHHGPDPSSEAINARIMVPGPGYDTKTIAEVIARKQQDILVDCLRRINPQIAGIAISEDMAYADIGLETTIPLNMCGSGLVRAADIVSCCILGQVHMLLIDEIESGLHHSAMPIVLGAMMSICQQQDIQVFFTTHSLEVLQCVQRVLGIDDFGRLRDETQTYRLARDKNDCVHAYRYDYDKFEHFVSRGLEIR